MNLILFLYPKPLKHGSHSVKQKIGKIISYLHISIYLPWTNNYLQSNLVLSRWKRCSEIRIKTYMEINRRNHRAEAGNFKIFGLSSPSSNLADSYLYLTNSLGIGQVRPPSYTIQWNFVQHTGCLWNILHPVQ